MFTSKNFINSLKYPLGLAILFLLIFLQMRGIIAIPSTLNILGLMEFKLYGLFIGIGLVFLITNVEKLFKKDDQRFLERVWLFILLSALLGARLWHVVTDYHIYKDNILSSLAVWNGGLSIFGGLIGGMLGMFFLLKIYKRLDILYKLLGSILLYLPISQSIGRLGNLVNQEIYGNPTNLPWGMYVEPQKRINGFENNNYFHPAFLYEIVGNLILFLVLQKIFMNNRNNFEYFVIPVYIFGYGLIRYVVNFFRIDIYTVETTSNITSLVMILIGLSLLTINIIRLRKSNVS